MSVLFRRLRLLSALLAVQFLECCDDPTPGTEADPTLKSVTVDQVYAHPARYSGPVRMAGRILAADTSESMVFFGCEDACVRIPVRYQGSLPSEGASAVAVGKVVRAEGGFVFEAREVRAQ